VLEYLKLSKGFTALNIKPLKYKQVEEELRQLAKTLPAGAKLPAERNLAIEYKCNFLTVRKALKYLVNDGLIVRRSGSGTFITDNKPSESSNTPPDTNRVGMLVYQESNAYAFSVLQSIAHAALETKTDLRSCWVTDFTDDALRQAEVLLHEGCSALTLPWFPPGMTNQVQDFLRLSPIPVSLPLLIPGLEKYCFEKAPLFGTTLLSGTEGLCLYFEKLGHHRIAFLGPDSPGNNIFQQKLGAYSCYMSRENLSPLCGMAKPTAHSMDQLAQRWKNYRGDLAIVSYDDEHALRFMTAMHKLGLSAPVDYVILGYNNTDASRYSDPPLSTVRQNFDHIGRWLLRNALALSRNEVDQATLPAPLDLLVRSTCGGKDKITPEFEKNLLHFNLRVVKQPAKAPAGESKPVAPHPDEVPAARTDTAPAHLIAPQPALASASARL
jgi:DNA-binding LacI/PurR family transcriptional regulator